MSIVIKGSEPFDIMIASNIANCQTANIKFKNISFRCETIEDADGTVFVKMPSAQPKAKEIGYAECADAMLKMWMDNVVTDGEYNRIMDKLNKYWGKVNA